MNNSHLEYVSVIVPVYNGEKYIVGCIEALLAQSYGRDNFEIIIADNGSTDNTRDIIARYNNVKMVIESEKRSSYAARNKALRSAKGEILAFTDADCRPDSRWLECGVNCLRNEKRIIVGGKISFYFTERRSAFERYDALYHMNQRDTIPRGMVATANMFASKDALEKVGLFREDLTSGGDADWSARAIETGYVLRYCDSAIVSHPTRTDYRELAGKVRRIGRGEGRRLALQDSSELLAVFKLILLLPIDTLRAIWPALKFFLKGKIGFRDFVLITPIAKWLFFVKRWAAIKYLLIQNNR